MVERLRAEKEKMKSGAKGGNSGGFFKLPKTDDAEVRVRILPAKNYLNEDGTVNSEPDLFYKRFGTHWVNGKSIVCPKHTHGDACPICETVNDLYNSGNEEDLSAAKEFKVKKRNWINLVEVDASGVIQGEAKVYEFGPKLLNNILDWCCDDDYYDLSDPSKGYDYRIIKKKVENFPNYDSSKPAKNSTKIPKEVLKGLLDKAADLRAIVDKRVLTYDEIKAGFDLGGGAADAGTDQEDGPAEFIDNDDLLGKINARLNSDND
jgi:hypothetical protein